MKKQDKLLRKALKHEKELMELRILADLLRSPIVQMVGTVAFAEILESMGLLSGRWAGALEGGVITMVGLQAIKDYGLIGGAAVGAGIGGGAITEGTAEGIKNFILGGALLGENAPLVKVWDATLGRYVFKT